MPGYALFDRARKRAQNRRLDFTIRREDIITPDVCPVLGIPLVVGSDRSPASPSLDRIDPSLGYVPGNIRVISDRANRLKSNRSLAHLLRLAEQGPAELQTEYRMVAEYVAREELLRDVRLRAAQSKRDSRLFKRLLPKLDRIFAVGLVEASITQ
ncbi:hypothetical protein [Sphingomonas sp.]|uniref:hypothetical protein n=1 Tax=Sphingomonas sp. TaxID=28214 RepID=UPI0038ACC89C